MSLLQCHKLDLFLIELLLQLNEDASISLFSLCILFQFTYLAFKEVYLIA